MPNNKTINTPTVTFSEKVTDTMEEKLSNLRQTIKTHHDKNRDKYTIAAVAVLGAIGWIANFRSHREFTNFLEDENIDPAKFYNPEFYAEKEKARKDYEDFFDGEVLSSLSRIKKAEIERKEIDRAVLSVKKRPKMA